MNKVNIGYCGSCDDYLDGPASLLPVADVLMRAHDQVCEARVLVEETEAHLSQRCDYIRLGGPGVKWRCVRYGCDGYHQLERVS
jgi:hypothetical protein